VTEPQPETRTIVLTLTDAEYAALRGGPSRAENADEHLAAGAADTAHARLARSWDQATVHYSGDDAERGGILLTRAQVREWTGLDRDLTGAELDRLARCIAGSYIPDSIETIVTEAMGLRRDECADCGGSPTVATVTGSRDRLCGPCALETEQDDSVAWDSEEARAAAVAGQDGDGGGREDRSS
jgi:hypothetical protein